MTIRQGAFEVGRLAAVVADVAAAEDLETGLRALVVGAMQLVGGTAGAVRVYDVGGAGCHLAFWADAAGRLEADAHPEPPPGSVAAALKAGGEARLIPDLWELAPEATDEERRARWHGARASIAVPISARAERIGSLHVDHPEPGRFHEEDQALLATLASHAGLVVERARSTARQARERAAHETVRLSERRYRALMEQSPLATQVFAPDGSVVAANAAWERLWGVGREALAGYNVRHDPQLEAKGVAPLIERAFGGEAVQIPALRYDPAEIGRPGRPRWLTGRLYPLRDEVGGLVEVVLILEDVTVARIAAAQRDHLYATAAALSARATPEEVAQEVAAHARAGLGAAEAAVVTLSDDAKWFEVLAQVGYRSDGAEAQAVMRAYRRFPADAPTPAGEVARTKRPVVLRDATARAARFPEVAHARAAIGDGAIAVQPLLVAQRLLGVLHVGFAEARELERDELAALEVFSHLAAQSLDRARLYADAREQASVHVTLNASLREAAEARERAVAALEQERQRLHEVFSRAPVALCVLRGPTHVVSVANAAFFGLMGLRDVTGRPLADALRDVPVPDREQVIRVLDEVFQTGTTFRSARARLPLAPRGTRYHVVCEPIREAAGDVTGICAAALPL